LRKNGEFGKIPKIWKNTKISKKIEVGTFFKVSLKFGGKIRKKTENS